MYSARQCNALRPRPRIAALDALELLQQPDYGVACLRECELL